MTFILAADGRDKDVVVAFNRYRAYLAESREAFPPGGYALATSDWYFDFRDHRCPHDAWLETFDLRETSSGERGESRTLSLEIRLLGAYHDGHIELRYPCVTSYALNINRCNGGHRDWRYDELRVSGQGTLIHEIEWSDAHAIGSWIIEASDLEFRWVPRQGSQDQLCAADSHGAAGFAAEEVLKSTVKAAVGAPAGKAT